MHKPLKTLVLAIIVGISASAVSAQSMIFTSLEGDRIDVEAQKGKVVVMAIGASWLPLSDDQAGTVNKLARKYAGRDDVVFYFIATDSASQRARNYASDDDLKKFGQRNKLNISILRDSEGEKSVRRYDIDQVPAFIILDKQGRPSGEPISGADPFGKVDPADLIARRVDLLI